MPPAERHRLRNDLLRMTERLIADYAGIIPAGSVMRTVARCHSQMRRLGVRDELVPVVEQAARTRLTAILSARAVA